MTDTVQDALRRLNPLIQTNFVGDGVTLPKGTEDPEVLLYAETDRLAVVTHDVTTMPIHVSKHLQLGHHTWGLLYFPNQWMSPGRIADELLMVWSCMTAEEWIDQHDFYPL